MIVNNRGGFASPKAFHEVKDRDSSATMRGAFAELAFRNTAAVGTDAMFAGLDEGNFVGSRIGIEGDLAVILVK